MIYIPGKERLFSVLIVLLLLASISCKSYKQNILFSSVPETSQEVFDGQDEPEKENFTIQIDDMLEVEVYSHKGERIIDPDNTLIESRATSQFKPKPKFLVRKNGLVDLPMVGDINLVGLTLNEANHKLSEAYSKYYTDPYVLVKFANKRIVIIGAPGGRVIPLENENTTLIEVISLAGGIGTNGKANNIKVFRTGKVYQFDLTVLNNWEQANFVMESGDIIYIEPIRKPLVESVRDIAPLINLVTSAITLVVLVITLL